LTCDWLGRPDGRGGRIIGSVIQLFGLPPMDPEDNNHNWPHAIVMLVDALRSYIRISEKTREDLLSLGVSTAEIDEPHLNRCRALLKEIEEKQVDPWVNDNRGPPEELP
jgi:hypothetical protein